MWLRLLVVLWLCSSLASAQRFSVSLRPELVLNFAQPSSFAVSVGGEARGLWRALGARVQAGFGSNFELSLDSVYRFDGSDYGNLYLGLGIGFSRVAEWRGLVGYEWDIGGRWRIATEAVVRAGFVGDPRLSFALMLVYLL
jgi:hypothetical protein